MKFVCIRGCDEDDTLQNKCVIWAIPLTYNSNHVMNYGLDDQ